MIARSTDRYELVQMLSRKGFIFEEGRRLTPFEDGTQPYVKLRGVYEDVCFVFTDDGELDTLQFQTDPEVPGMPRRTKFK